MEVENYTFIHTVSNRQTDVRTAILNYRKALLLKKNCPFDKRAFFGPGRFGEWFLRICKAASDRIG